ncbi:carboxypeptidase regulatory-like domain-containing protein [Calditrichota bacterium]
MNSGVSVYFDVGSQNSGIPIDVVEDLENEFMTPVVWDLADRTGDWSNDYGKNEAYIRAGTPESPCGAIGATGIAFVSTYFPRNNLFHSGAAYATYVLDMPSLGHMYLGGKMGLWIPYGESDLAYVTNSFLLFNLMGDPTVWLWKGEPQTLTVTAEEEVELGSNSCIVTVEDEELNEPVENAWVTFYKVDEDEDIIARGETDENGYVTLSIPVRFTGEALLTITKPQFAPYRSQIDIISPDSRIGYLDITFVDDGEDDTNGDGDGIPESGETVGLLIQAKNFGIRTEDNIEFTASTNEDWIESINGTASLRSLTAGQSALCTGLVLIEIAHEAQQDWTLHVDLEINTENGGEYADELLIPVSAPAYCTVDVTPEDDLDPGETYDLVIEVINIGGQDAAASTGILYSNEPYIWSTDNEAEFTSMDIAETASGTFEVTVSREAIGAYIAKLELVITTDDGQVDTVSVSVQLGDGFDSHPAGPDNYGYFALDEEDTMWVNQVPTYDWIEINPDVDDFDFEGIDLDLNDGENDAGGSVALELPFTIQYYGEEFSEISVCTNGWVAMGDQSDFVLQYNYPIPSSLGPNNQICPYWDHFFINGDASVYVCHDENSGRYIIEWFEVSYYNDLATATFELIFYNQDVCPTPTGDNEMLFQYQSINHQLGSFWEPSYWTTGIENGTQTDGLQLAYWNEMSPGMCNITSESAIRITTNVQILIGSISGTVIDQATGESIPDVLVTVGDNRYAAQTDENGTYFLENVTAGEYAIFFARECFVDTSLLDLVVAADETTVVNISMRHPEFALDPHEIQYELEQDEQITIPVEITNSGNSLMHWSVEMFFRPRNQEDQILPVAPWLCDHGFELDETEDRNRGIASMDYHYYVSGSNNFDMQDFNKIYKYDRDGILLRTYDQPVPADQRSTSGIYGLATDGEYLYGSDNNRMFQMEFQINDNENNDSLVLVDSWELPLQVSRWIAYDPDENLFWMGSYNTSIFAVDRDGEIVREYEHEYSIRGAGWYSNDLDGFDLYLVSRIIGYDNNQYLKMNTTNGDLRLLFETEEEEGVNVPSGADINNAANPAIASFAILLDNDSDDNVTSWIVGPNDSTCIEITRTNGTLPGDSTESIDLVLRGLDIPRGDNYDYLFRFENDACVDSEETWIAVNLSISEAVDIIGSSENQPLEWAFQGVYPNPFNPILAVDYSLKKSTFVNAVIYNLLGQQVAILADMKMPAGYHNLTFDGSHLSSGMYFLSFNAGPINEMKKLVLLK